MKLEQRYLVIKVRDAKIALSEHFMERLNNISRIVDDYRQDVGKKSLNGIFIENDWHEYKVIEKMLSDRVNAEKEEK